MNLRIVEKQILTQHKGDSEMRKSVGFTLLFLVLFISSTAFASIGLGGGLITPQATSAKLYQANVFLGVTDNLAMNIQVVKFTSQVAGTYLIDPYVELRVPVIKLVMPVLAVTELYAGVAPIFSYSKNTNFRFEKMYFAKTGVRLTAPLLSVYGEYIWTLKFENGSIEYSPDYLISFGAMLFFK